MKIMPNRMDYGFLKYQQEFEDKALEVLRSGWYVLGKEVSAFEERFAAYTPGQNTAQGWRTALRRSRLPCIFWESAPVMR